MVNDKIGRESNDRAFSIILPIKVSSRFLAIPGGDFWCIHVKGKQTREMDTALSKRYRS